MNFVLILLPFSKAAQTTEQYEPSLSFLGGDNLYMRSRGNSVSLGPLPLAPELTLFIGLSVLPVFFVSGHGPLRQVYLSLY